MIVSVFIRYYKAFTSMKHIPISLKDYFSLYFGTNGVGKSSVLEALDSFFNDREWNINKNAKNASLYPPCIVPVFMMDKEKFSRIKNKDLQTKIENLSDFFWNVQKDKFSNPTSEMNEFLNIGNN
jgi:DNA repair ATPase RecN